MSKSQTIVSTKGQVILPKAVRDRRKWGEGTRLTVEETEDGVLLKEAKVIAPTKPGAAFGMLRHKGKPKTIEQMHGAVLDEARRRHARNRY